MKKGTGNNSVSLRDFNIKGCLGKGSYGDVYLVTKKENIEKEYALKCLDRLHLQRENKSHQVLLERAVLTCHSSEWLIKLFACFQDEDKLYLLLENVSKGELLEYIESDMEISPQQIQFIAAEIICILELMWNSGIVHRDIKPSNLLFDDRNHLKVIDFGTYLALDNGKNAAFLEQYNKLLTMKQRRQTLIDEGIDDSFVGTPLFLSPEMISEDNVSYPVDLWAFGITLFQMLTGKLPHEELSEFDLYEKIKDAQIDIPEV